MEVFPLIYSWEADEQCKFYNTHVQYMDGGEQIQRNAVNPTITWNVTCKGSKEDMDKLRQFYSKVYGSFGVFGFFDPDGNKVLARFATDEPSIKMIRCLDATNPTKFAVVGFEASVSVKKVWQ